MKNKLKIENFNFLSEALYVDDPKDFQGTYWNQQLDDLGKEGFQKVMFSMFSDFFEKFNHLPYAGHTFYLSEDDMHIRFTHYETHSNVDIIFVFFEPL